MSNSNYTHIVLLLDGSGSMTSTKAATIEGINSFIESQKHPPSLPEDRNLSLEDDLSDSHVEIKCTVTLAIFSSTAPPTLSHINSSTSNYFNSLNNQPTTMANGEPAESYYYSKLYDAVDILTAPPLTNENYQPHGGTPLYDAFYRTITECSSFVSRLKEEDRPGRIIIVSNTDGEENSSTKTTIEVLRNLITDKTALNWQFIYLGANQDAFTSSASMGVMRGQSLNYVQDSKGISESYTKLSHNVLQKRSLATDMMFTACISDMDDSVIGSTTIDPGTTSTSISASATTNNLVDTTSNTADGLYKPKGWSSVYNAMNKKLKGK